MSITLNGTTGITTPASTVGGSAVLTTASSLASANLTGALPAIDGAALTGGVGLLVASGPVNGGVNAASSTSAQTHTVFTFTMPANKTKVVISGSWSSWAAQAANGYCLIMFHFTTNTGNLSEQANNWQGGAGIGPAHVASARDVILTGVSAGTSVTISLVMSTYESALCHAYYSQSQCTAIAY